MLAVRAIAPVDDLSFVNREAVIVDGFETGPIPHRAVHIGHQATAATNDVVMVVVNPTLVTSSRSRWLNTSDYAPVGQQTERVEHRLTRDRPDAAAHILDDLIGSAVRTGRYRRQHSQALGCDLQPMLSQLLFGILDHTATVNTVLDLV